MYYYFQSFYKQYFFAKSHTLVKEGLWWRIFITIHPPDHFLAHNFQEINLSNIWWKYSRSIFEIIRYKLDTQLDSTRYSKKRLIIGVVHKYVDKFLAFFDHLPPFVYTSYLMKVDIILTTYPPLVINLLCERTLGTKKIMSL